jgi:hypothetical protein
LATITQAYLKVRYGEFPENRQVIANVETAWEQVHVQGQKMHHQLTKDQRQSKGS